jgi:antagonist of KipI
VSLLMMERAGMFTTVQDLGRWGFQAWGVPVSGAMDPWSARLANRLVGNPDDAALLEVTLIGPRFTVDRDTTVAITGASFDIEVPTERLRAPCVVRLRAGDALAFGARHRGSRAYVAIDGGIDVPEVLGSRSTHARSGLGGLHGGALRTGDRVPMSAGSTKPPDVRRDFLPLPTTSPAVLHVLAPDDADVWLTEAFEALCATEFAVSPRSDRMGYRLDGHSRLPEGRGTIVSQPTAPGAIQLPPDGVPILLMADRQTTGGYAQIAVLQRADWAVSGQLAPGDLVRFRSTTHAAALDAHRALERWLDGCAPEVRHA